MRGPTLPIALVLALSACNSSSNTPAENAAPTPAPAPAEQAAVQKPEGPPKASVEDIGFKLALEKDAQYTAGQPGTVKLVLEARGGYHVNQDYPIRVDLKAPSGVKLTKASLAKADAAQFGEQSARFDVGFSADKGAHDLTAVVDFAVCTPETCVPDQRTLAVALNVQ